MITRTLLLAAFAAFALQATAQDTPAPPAQEPAAAAMPLGTKPQDVAKELGLSEKQVADLQLIDHEHGEKMKEMNRQNLETQAKRARVTELRDKKQADMQKVMTPEQWAKWLEMKQAQRDASAKQRETLKKKSEHQE